MSNPSVKLPLFIYSLYSPSVYTVFKIYTVLLLFEPTVTEFSLECLFTRPLKVYRLDKPNSPVVILYRDSYKC